MHRPCNPDPARNPDAACQGLKVALKGILNKLKLKDIFLFFNSGIYKVGSPVFRYCLAFMSYQRWRFFLFFLKKSKRIAYFYSNQMFLI